MKTCGFCKTFCQNKHCVVYEENMTEFDKLMEKLEWTTIYTKDDMKKAYEAGKQEQLDELKRKVKGMSVNGIVQGILTEKDLE